MRSFWMLISGTALVVGLGGLVYYIFPKHLPTSDIPSGVEVPPTSGDNRVLVLPATNPLLTATRQDFNRWLPSYPLRCGAILYEGARHRPPDAAFCIHEITKRVVGATGTPLTQDQILDPGVKAHWTEVMKGG